MVWHPDKNHWKVLAQVKPKDKVYQKKFLVDDHLKGAEFLQQKLDKYILAIDEWNSHDKSTRHRILAPSLLVGVVKKDEPSEGFAPGVQPIPASTLPSQSSASSSDASAIMRKAEDAEDEWMFHLRNKQMDEEQS